MLKGLSENGIQIIYTTHEKSFVDISNFQNIHLVRKESGQTKVYSGIGKEITEWESIKLASKFDENINEVFFANHVILTEGPDDKIACRFALENLGIELDKEGLSIIECGSNTAIKPIGEVLKYFKIPTYALLDKDPGNENTRKIISELKALLGEDNVFLQDPNLEGLFNLSEKLNKAEALKYFSNYFSKKDAIVPEIYKKIREKLKNDTFTIQN